jgi:hypothetical protein
MKYIFGAIIFCCITNIACNGIFTEKKKFKDFIPGTYVHFFESKFTKGSDTLVISRMGGNAYSILDKISYHFLKEDMHLPDTHESRHYTAVYDEKDKILKEINSYRTFRFEPDINRLYMGNTKFEKVKYDIPDLF